jgi:hypothetical protein
MVASSVATAAIACLRRLRIERRHAHDSMGREVQAQGGKDQELFHRSNPYLALASCHACGKLDVTPITRFSISPLVPMPSRMRTGEAAC